MTLLRKLAAAISQRVVNWSSPGGKEWAEGLAREAEAIPSDWAAFCWSLGSVRVLAQWVVRRDVPRPPGWYLWPIAQVLLTLEYMAEIVRGTNWHDRIASALLAFGWGCWAAYTVAGLVQEQNQPPVSDIRAYQRFSKEKLERRLKRYRSPMRWLPVLVPVALCVGFLMTFQGVGLGYVPEGLIVLFSAVAILALVLDTPAKIQERLDRLNERIAESEGKSGAAGR